jgi:hypothetical protein
MLYYYEINEHKTLSKKTGGNKMGTIICKSCLDTMEHFEEEKVTVLYSHCGCDHETEIDN